MSKINCKFCNKKIGVKRIMEHLPKCIPNYFNYKSGYLIEFMSVGDVTNKMYSMFAIFGTKCKFSHIDNFLKNKWCTCCEHIATLDVFEKGDEPQNHKSVKFNTRISKYEYANQFCYSYDLGSTTTIYFRILKKLDGVEPNYNLNPNYNSNTNPNSNTNIELIYQNEPFVLKCKNLKTCKSKEAIYIYFGDLLCNECKLNIKDSKYLQNIVNSPRTGVCVYNGE